MDNARTLGKAATAFSRWVLLTKHIPGWRAQEPTGIMPKDLARLAETSLHLLCDIGFERDPGSSSPTRRVWKSDAPGIAVVILDTGAQVHLEDLTTRAEDAAPT